MGGPGSGGATGAPYPAARRAIRKPTIREQMSNASRVIDMIDSRWWATLAVAVAVTVVFLASRPILDRRLEEGAARYHAGKLIRYAVGAFTIVALAVIWRGFAGRAGEIVGFAAAGVAFAMQEVIGALAGWFNIVSGHIFKVGDRIEMGGVRGDVIDVTLLRTKIMEIGSPGDGPSWVKGRQYTGRIVDKQEGDAL